MNGAKLNFVYKLRTDDNEFGAHDMLYTMKEYILAMGWCTCHDIEWID